MASGAAIYAFGLFVQLDGYSRSELQRRWRRHYAFVIRAGLPSGAFSCISFLIVGLLQQSIYGTALRDLPLRRVSSRVGPSLLGFLVSLSVAIYQPAHSPVTSSRQSGN